MYWTSPVIWVCTDCARKVDLLDPIAHAQAHRNLGRCPTCKNVGGLVKLQVQAIQRKVKDLRMASGLSFEALEFDPKITLRQEPGKPRLPKPNFKFTGGVWQACPKATARLKQAATSRV